MVPYDEILTVCDDSCYNYELLMTYKQFAEYVIADERFDYQAAEANGWDTDEIPLELEGYEYTCNLTSQGVWIMGGAEAFVNSDWFYLLNHSENIYVRKIYEDDKVWEMVVNY